jgi:folate-binding protein YgfZ
MTAPQPKSESSSERAMETAGAPPVLETPLADLHRQSGANLGVWFGAALPNDYGDSRAEYFFAKQSVALIDKTHRSYLSFTGPDRVRYLNAMLTNNIKDLAVGQGVASLLLNPQGHILAELETYGEPDKLFCISYAMIREQLVATLDKFIIMDDVALTDDTERYGTLALEGPAAPQLIAELTGVDLNALPGLSTQQARIGSIPCPVTRRSPGKVGSGEFLIERRHLAEMWNLLLEKARAAGGGPMGYSALSALRLEQGVPWFSYDFGEKQIPHEAGLQDSHISFTKGCYTGQEIVERVRSRGQVNRRRVDLVFNTATAPPAGTILTLAGKEVGYITRSGAPPALPFGVGMGYARKEANAVGTVLEIPGGSATISSFPVDSA